MFGDQRSVFTRSQSSTNSIGNLKCYWRALALVSGFLPVSAAIADDVTAPVQVEGAHSTVSTEDGRIRDDELIDFICDRIDVNGGKGSIKDVKIMVNSCFGGGLLDDMERAFGPGGACEGIPWVGGSASAPDQTAQGYADSTVAGFPGENLGSTWTDALAGNSHLNTNGQKGVISKGSNSNNVLKDLVKVGIKDSTGPNGDKQLESPQVASGNGGDSIRWNTEGGKHEAVVFGGKQTDQRHHNNVDNVKDALENTWDSAPNNIQVLDGATTDEFLEALETAIDRLDKDTQLVIYIDGHGGTTQDISEKQDDLTDVLLVSEQSANFDWSDGAFKGFYGNYFSSTKQIPTPTLDLHIDQCDGCSEWVYRVNGMPVLFPGLDRTGLVQIPLPAYEVFPGINLLQFGPSDEDSVQASGAGPKFHNGTMTLSRIEISSGPINELEPEQVLLPAQSAVYYDPERNGEGIFVELLGNGLALIYMFSYTPDGTGQSWMVGLGQQVGNGVIINEMLIPTGAEFGPGFDPGDVVRTDFGHLAFLFPTCGTSEEPGSLFVFPESNLNWGPMVSHNYVQLTSIIDCDTEEGSANKSLSGTWYDISHDGEGIIVEVMANGQAMVQWFTYDENGNQVWIQGTGTFEGNELTVEGLFTTQGPKWGPEYDASTITLPDWGVLRLTFSGCDAVTMDYDSSAGFGAGTLNMIRLSSLMGIACVQ